MPKFTHTVVKVSVLCSLCVGGSIGHAGDLGELTRVPDLRPSLSQEEVTGAFGDWKQQAERVISQKPSGEVLEMIAKAKAALANELPDASSITFYSLYPTTSQELRNIAAENARELQKRVTFHDYPVLGTVELNDAREIRAWTEFLRHQVIPGAMSFCDFEPRHGIRFNTAKGDIDIVICFSCDQLAFHGTKKLDQAENPMLSRGVKDVLNLLFDKRSIKRDIPGQAAKN